MRFSVEKFAGMLPKHSAKTLPENNAAYSLNAYTSFDDLRSSYEDITQTTTRLPIGIFPDATLESLPISFPCIGNCSWDSTAKLIQFTKTDATQYSDAGKIFFKNIIDDRYYDFKIIIPSMTGVKLRWYYTLTDTPEVEHLLETYTEAGTFIKSRFSLPAGIEDMYMRFEEADAGSTAQVSFINLYAYPEDYTTSSQYGDVTIDTEIKTIYPYELDDNSIQWICSDKELNILKGPIANDENNRTFFTGLDVPRVFDKTMLGATDLTLTENNTYILGIPAPEKATLTGVTGTGGEDVDPIGVSYVMAYVRKWSDDKEDVGALSPAAETTEGEKSIEVIPGQSVNMTLPTAPADAAARGITHINIYRSAVGTSSASYLLVEQVEISTTNYTDEKDEVNLGTAAISGNYDPPIDNLKGLVSLQNGILVGFDGYDIYFSEPYQPHTFPEAYKVTLDYKITGLGTYQNTVVAATEEYPFSFSVSDPEVVIPTPISTKAPCCSSRSIVSTSAGTLFASKAALMLVYQGIAIRASDQTHNERSWANMNPSTIKAALYNDKYYGFFISKESPNKHYYFSFDPLEPEEGVHFYETFFPKATACASFKDRLYYLGVSTTGTQVIAVLDEPSTYRKIYNWRSRDFVSSDGEITLAAGRVTFAPEYVEPIDGSPFVGTEDPQWLSTLQNPINSHYLNYLPVGGSINTSENRQYLDPNSSSVTFRLYVDDEYVYSCAVNTDEPFALPSGHVGRVFAFEVEGTRPVSIVDVATSIEELL